MENAVGKYRYSVTYSVPIPVSRNITDPKVAEFKSIVLYSGDSVMGVEHIQCGFNALAMRESVSHEGFLDFKTTHGIISIPASSCKVKKLK
jgi:hypothetical protein